MIHYFCHLQNTGKAWAVWAMFFLIVFIQEGRFIYLTCLDHHQSIRQAAVLQWYYWSVIIDLSPYFSLECSTVILHFPVPAFQLSSLPGARDINLIAWSSLLSKQYPSYSNLLDPGPGNGEKKFKKSLDISLSLTLLPSLAFIARIQWKDIVRKRIIKKSKKNFNWFSFQHRGI